MTKNRNDLPSRISGVLSTILAVVSLSLLMMGEWRLGVFAGVAAIIFFIGWVT